MKLRKDFSKLIFSTVVAITATTAAQETHLHTKWHSLTAADFRPEGRGCAADFLRKTILIDETFPSIDCSLAWRIGQLSLELERDLQWLKAVLPSLQSTPAVGFYWDTSASARPAFFEKFDDRFVVAFNLAQAFSRTSFFHEFQHFLRQQALGPQKKETPWINEGLSRWSEGFFLKISPLRSIENTLSRNQTVSLLSPCFELHEKCSPTDRDLAYTSAFLFTQYLIEHFGGENFAWKWINSPNSGIENVEELVSAGNIDLKEDLRKLPSLFLNYSVALAINNPGLGTQQLWSFARNQDSQISQIRLAPRPLTFQKINNEVINSDFDFRGLQTALFDLPVGPYCLSLPQFAGIAYVQILEHGNERERVRILHSKICGHRNRKLLIVDTRWGEAIAILRPSLVMQTSVDDLTK